MPRLQGKTFDRPQTPPSASWPWAGVLVAMAVALVMLGSLIMLLTKAESFTPSVADWGAVRFSLSQAAVSALVSVGAAIPVARALARRRFVGRAWLITALGAPFLLPVIVAVLGLLAIFGRAGLANQALGGMGLPSLSIYGFHGVILAHVFLNLPLAVRMLLQGWASIPAERIMLAQSLGLGPSATLRHIEWPMLRTALPGALLAVFLICLTSFAVVLILGGGPNATTVELAIYQALRFDFDLGRAAVLAGVQFLLCAGAVLLASRLTGASGLVGGGLDRQTELPRPRGLRRTLDGFLIVLTALFLLAPLALVVWRGAPELASLPASVWWAAVTSVGMALATAAVTGVTVLALASAAVKEGKLARLIEVCGMLPMAASGLALGTGLFLMLYPFVAPSQLALPVAILVNSLMALPFALRLILPAWRQAEATQGRLADSLGLGPLARMRLAILPRVRRPLGMALGLAAALAMGDIGVIALFASDQGVTLPLQVWRLMGAYRSAQAEGAALLLVALSFGLFFIFDHWGRRNAQA